MKKNRKGFKWQYYVIIPAAVIAVLSLLFLGFQAINATMGKGAPVFGSRFENDLNPEISQDSMDKIVADIKEMNGVKDASAVLKSATLRVYVEIDTNREANISANLENVYDIIANELKVEDYFSVKGVQKQYDLEVHGYNMVPNEENEGYIYGVLIKNANMLEASSQILTKPQSQEIIDYFYAEEKRKDELNEQPAVEEEVEVTE